MTAPRPKPTVSTSTRFEVEVHENNGADTRIEYAPHELDVARRDAHLYRDAGHDAHLYRLTTVETRVEVNA